MKKKVSESHQAPQNALCFFLLFLLLLARFDTGNLACSVLFRCAVCRFALAIARRKLDVTGKFDAAAAAAGVDKHTENLLAGAASAGAGAVAFAAAQVLVRQLQKRQTEIIKLNKKKHDSHC